MMEAAQVEPSRQCVQGTGPGKDLMPRPAHDASFSRSPTTPAPGHGPFSPAPTPLVPSAGRARSSTWTVSCETGAGTQARVTLPVADPLPEVLDERHLVGAGRPDHIFNPDHLLGPSGFTWRWSIAEVRHVPSLSGLAPLALSTPLLSELGASPRARYDS